MYRNITVLPVRRRVDFSSGLCYALVHIMAYSPAVYFATVCIEPNRWSSGRTPQISASFWIERALSDGFDGIELWENHYVLADRDERNRIAEALGAAPAPTILSSYWDFSSDAPQESGVAGPLELRAALAALPCGGIKFNVGKDPDCAEAYQKLASVWLPRFHSAMDCTDARLICECHGGTVLETPEAARAFRESTGLSTLEFVIHPLSLDEHRLEQWMDTGHIGHLHIQSREAPLHAVPDARSRLETVLGGAPGASVAIEFSRGAGAPGEYPEATYGAAREDLRFLRSFLDPR